MMTRIDKAQVSARGPREGLRVPNKEGEVVSEPWHHRPVRGGFVSEAGHRHLYCLLPRRRKKAAYRSRCRRSAATGGRPIPLMRTGSSARKHASPGWAHDDAVWSYGPTPKRCTFDFRLVMSRGIASCMIPRSDLLNHCARFDSLSTQPVR